MADPPFSEVVALACHDVRSPLATVSGFAKTLLRTEGLPGRTSEFLGMIDAAADEIAKLLNDLALLALIEGGRYDPALADSDTLELATGTDDRVAAVGTGDSIRTDAPAVRRALEALGVAAARHGSVDRVVWTVNGRDLRLEPVSIAAGPIVAAVDARDFGSIVARRVIEALGGSVAVDGETLAVRL